MPVKPSFTALILLLSSSLLLACSRSTADTDPRSQAASVLVTTVQTAQAHTERLLGLVQAKASSPLSFQTSGKVLERLVQNGEQVKQGQVLMRLDPKDAEQQKRAQDAAVQAAQAQYSQAQAELKRQQLLVKEGAVSRQAYEYSLQAAQSAAANLRAAQAQQQLAQHASGYTVLYAHADGIISDIQADQGQVVATGQTVAMLAEDGPRELELSLPESMNLPLGTRAVAYDAKQNRYSATLSELAQQADPYTRTYKARFSLGEVHEPLRLGTSLWLNLPTTSPTTLVRVPITALYDPGTGPGVWLLDSNQLVRFEAVSVDRLDAEYAYLSQGPAPQTQVVAVGAALLHEGQPVRPLPERAARP